MRPVTTVWPSPRRAATMFSLAAMLAALAACAADAPSAPVAEAVPGTTMSSLADAQASGRRILLRSAVATNRCMDVNGASRSAGTALITWTCSTSAANQQFAFNAAGELRVYDTMCVDAANNTGRDGDPVVIWTCNGGRNQKWTGTSGGHIRGVNNKCIVVKNGTTTAGARLVLGPCTSAAAARWSEQYVDGSTSAPAPVASVVVTPASASVVAGQGTQLGATARDASGNVLTGRTITWSSSAANVATVNASGWVTGVAAGTATVTATSEGRSGTATITVTAATTSPVRIDTIFNEGFESGTLSAWQDGVNTSVQRIITTNPRSGARALEVNVPAGSDGTWLTRFFMPGYDSIYVRFYVRYSDSWRGGSKLLALRGSPTNNQWGAFGKAGVCPNGTDFFSATVVTDGGLGPTPGPVRLYDYFLGMQSSGGYCWGNYGEGQGAVYNEPQGTTSLAPQTSWHLVETFVRLNRVGHTDSRHIVWVDGVKRGEWSGMTFRTTTNLKLNSAMLSISLVPTQPQAQQIYFDDVLVLTGRPGGID